MGTSEGRSPAWLHGNHLAACTMHTIVFPPLAKLMSWLQAKVPHRKPSILSREQQEMGLPPPLRRHVLAVTDSPCPNMCLIRQY